MELARMNNGTGFNGQQQKRQRDILLKDMKR